MGGGVVMSTAANTHGLPGWVGSGDSPTTVTVAPRGSAQCHMAASGERHPLVG
jgi:hypothetical protein